MKQSNIPTHIAIIPDGNRRWAKHHGLSSFEGHRRGAEEIVPALIERASELGISYITFWALSTENNLNRSHQELDGLYKLMRFFLNRKLNEFNKKGIQLKFIGDVSTLPKDIYKGIQEAIIKTKNNKKITSIFAVNYGGRDEIVRAVKKIKNSKLKIQNLNKENFKTLLDTVDIPDPDLIIRTGGEKRTSGFLLWQSEYAEYAFVDTYFPDFTAEEFEKSVKDFMQRQRRFGG